MGINETMCEKKTQDTTNHAGRELREFHGVSESLDVFKWMIGERKPPKI